MLLVIFGYLQLLNVFIDQPVILNFGQDHVYVFEGDEVFVEEEVEAAQVAFFEDWFAGDAVAHGFAEGGFGLAFNLVCVVILAGLD